MSTEPTTPNRPDPGPFWRWPQLADDDRVIGGVSAGLGREIGIEPGWVRLGFVALFASGGWGALFYGAVWVAMAMRAATHPELLPLDQRVPKARTSGQRYVGFGLLVGGMTILALQVGGFPGSIVVPVGLLGAGTLLGWSQLTNRSNGAQRRGRVRRMVLSGISLLMIAIALTALTSSAGTDVAGGSTLPAIGAMAVLVTLSAPWWWRLVRERDAERQARVRSEERAEVAAHLHDSVLQTLSLIQRNSDDPKMMLSLARRQERELRNWLDPNRVSRQGGSIRGQIDEMATTVEELHRVPVEVVAVGDCLVDEQIESLLGAAREATVNAAKHAGSDQIDLYVEVSDDAIEIFVRDTGTGFDIDTIDDDRHGIRQSIVGRMKRVGGSATITSAPGEGTEVELLLQRTDSSGNGHGAGYGATTRGHPEPPVQDRTHTQPAQEQEP
jgi:signal transduction histidine kinase/phage shock protein PspC (stress-responsive transcriptional regulator)